MRKWQRLVRFRDWNLDKKLIFVYASMVIIPVIIVTLLGFQRYHDNLTERVSEYGLNLADQISTNLDNYIQQIDRLSMTFYLDGVDGLTGKQDPMSAYTEKIAVDRALRNIMLIIPFQDIEGIYWIRDGEVQYSQFGSGKWTDHSSFAAEGWYAQVLEADGRGVVIPPYRPLATGGVREQYIFSYARSIVNVSNRNPYGVLLIDITTNFLHSLLTESKIQTSSTLSIVDGDGKIIYHPNNALINQSFEPTMEGAYGKFVSELDAEPTLVQFVRSSVTGWAVVNTVPVRQLSAELSLLRNLLWTFAGAVLLLALILSSALTVSIVGPLKRMKRLMHRVEMGDYNVRLRTNANDEVGQLGRSFNHMVEQINALVNRVLTMKIYQQQAEFELLRSQINPHFLFNTLESINMKAELNEDYEVADMVSLLGKLFRLSLQQNAEQITLARELEYVDVYMRLQRIRFPKMSYSIDFSAELLEAYTLPWIIQPLAENAIVHAIAPAGGSGSIHIRGLREGDDGLLIEIIDDGAGISEERLAELLESLGQPQEQGDGEQHIGVYNVHKRISSYWGQGYGLSMQRRPEGGTVVQLRMKLSKGGDEDAGTEDDDRRR